MNRRNFIASLLALPLIRDLPPVKRWRSDSERTAAAIAALTAMAREHTAAVWKEALIHGSAWTRYSTMEIVVPYKQESDAFIDRWYEGAP